MKKLMIGIIILSIGLMAYGGYTSRRWSAPSATTDVNYAELAALIDANDLTDPNSHNAVTVTDSNSIDFTLTGQNITGDVNEVWLAANAGTGSVATHESTYDHNDIATALQPSAIGTTIQAYDSNLPDFPVDPDSDKYLKWDDANGVLVWDDPNGSGTGDMLKATYDTDDDGFADMNTADFLTAAQTQEQIEDWVGAMLPSPDTYLDDTNNIRRTFEKTFNIPDPNYYYKNNTNHRLCIDPNSKYAITITEIGITCNANPDTELDWNFKFADAYIGVANATLVVAINTTAGVADIDSGFNDATIPANKCWYVEFDAQPDGAIEEVCVTIRGYYD